MMYIHWAAVLRNCRFRFAWVRSPLRVKGGIADSLVPMSAVEGIADIQAVASVEFQTGAPPRGLMAHALMVELSIVHIRPVA